MGAKTTASLYRVIGHEDFIQGPVVSKLVHHRLSYPLAK
jgi:hypothetical protein